MSLSKAMRADLDALPKTRFGSEEEIYSYNRGRADEQEKIAPRLALLEAVVRAAQPYRNDMVTDCSVTNGFARAQALTNACMALDNYDKEVKK